MPGLVPGIHVFEAALLKTGSDEQAIGRNHRPLRELPEERQQAAAVLLLDFLEHREDGIELTAEQIAEIEPQFGRRRICHDEEVKAFFDRIGQ